MNYIHTSSSPLLFILLPTDICIYIYTLYIFIYLPTLPVYTYVYMCIDRYLYTQQARIPHTYRHKDIHMFSFLFFSFFVVNFLC